MTSRQLPTLVLDLDDCMLFSKTRKPDPNLNKWIQSIMPGSLCWELEFEIGDKKVCALHVIPPGWIPCLRYVLSKLNWDLAIFSAGISARNLLVRDLLAQELKLDSDAKIQVFSKENLKNYDDFPFEGVEKWIPEKHYGTYKKDLVHVGLNIKETLLVDDDPSYILAPYQWPQLVVSTNGGARELSEWLLAPVMDEDERNLMTFPEEKSIQDFLNVPYETLGFILNCEELRAQDKSMTLRDAMKVLLPTLTLEASKTASSSQRAQWIAKGRDALQEFKAKS